MNKLILSAVLGLVSVSAMADDYYRDDDRNYARSSYDNCDRCGEVVRINSYGGERHASGGGAVAGAVIGGLLGNQVGSGDGRKAATVVGAVAGGIAGNNIEKNRRGGNRYEIIVQMDDGRRVAISQSRLNGVDEGDRVYVSGGRVRQL